MSIGELIEKKVDGIAEDAAKLHTEIMSIKVAGASHLQNEIYNQTGRHLDAEFSSKCAATAFDEVVKQLLNVPTDDGMKLGEFSMKPKAGLALIKHFDVRGRVLAYLDDVCDPRARELSAQVKAGKAGHRDNGESLENEALRTASEKAGWKHS